MKIRLGGDRVDELPGTEAVADIESRGVGGRWDRGFSCSFYATVPTDEYTSEWANEQLTEMRSRIEQMGLVEKEGRTEVDVETRPGRAPIASVVMHAWDPVRAEIERELDEQDRLQKAERKRERKERRAELKELDRIRDSFDEADAGEAV